MKMSQYMLCACVENRVDGLYTAVGSCGLPPLVAVPNFRVAQCWGFPFSGKSKGVQSDLCIAKPCFFWHRLLIWRNPFLYIY